MIFAASAALFPAANQRNTSTSRFDSTLLASFCSSRAHRSQQIIEQMLLRLLIAFKSQTTPGSLWMTESARSIPQDRLAKTWFSFEAETASRLAVHGKSLSRQTRGSDSSIRSRCSDSISGGIGPTRMSKDPHDARKMADRRLTKSRRFQIKQL